MPLLYREGDVTILAWGLNVEDYRNPAECRKHMSSLSRWRYLSYNEEDSFLAASPAEFQNCDRLRRMHPTKMVLTNVGLEIKVPLLEFSDESGYSTWLAILNCGLDESNDFVSILLDKYPHKDRGYRPLGFIADSTHAFITGAREAAKATLQDVIIQTSLHEQERDIGNMTHILLLPTDGFIQSGFSISHAGFMHKAAGTTGGKMEVLWRLDNGEVIIKDAASEDWDWHQYCLGLCVTHDGKQRDPSYCIHMCPTCGKYTVKSWYPDSCDDVRSYYHASEEIHEGDEAALRTQQAKAAASLQGENYAMLLSADNSRAEVPSVIRYDDALDPRPPRELRQLDKRLARTTEKKFLKRVANEQRSIRELGYIPMQSRSQEHSSSGNNLLASQAVTTSVAPVADGVFKLTMTIKEFNHRGIISLVIDLRKLSFRLDKECSIS